ncbi:class I SAM-dependent methyltransferase [Alteromonas sp. M12]|uniref:class I SAM-dependent methyltransferase n=1 Tax=Alteromonas sp. M12 TaxID=3135644 RepID=UPI00319E8257
MKVIIYGTGSKALENVTAIALNFNLIGFCESHALPGQKQFLGKEIFSIKELHSLQADLIIICSSFLLEITDVLNQVGIKNYVSVDDLSQVAETLDELKQSYEVAETQKLAQMKLERLKTEHVKNASLLANRQLLLEKLSKNTIGAEIGVAAGKFTKDILNIVTPKKLHLIDIWGSDRYSEKLLTIIQGKYETQLREEKIYIHRKLSIEAAEDFENEYFDWVYIDTDHSYHTTYQELNLYSKKIKRDGWILGHDYCMGNWSKRYKYGVIEAVHRFCVENDYEIVYLTMEISQSFALRKIIQ